VEGFGHSIWFDTEASGDEGKRRFVGSVNSSLVVLDVDAFDVRRALFQSAWY
jgi:hypothetical protein